jgi:Cys-tRNA(Pro)/Cys-tRNA(Cys) deacylase
MLENYLKTMKSPAEIVVYSEPVHSVDQASTLLNSTPDRFVKTICFESSEGVFVSVIVLGSQKVDPQPIQEYLTCSQLRPATKESIFSHTGYEVGGIPPVGYESVFFVDPAVMSKNQVFAGGGDGNTLITITPAEILRLNSGVVIECSK